MELPAIYRREAKSCYYDAYRKKLIEITPEETVRQRVAAFFEQQCGVPKDMISLEVPMSYYTKGVAGMYGSKSFKRKSVSVFYTGRIG